MSEEHTLPPPPEPESVEETGLSTTTLEQLILKILYFRGELYGQDLSVAMGLKYSVIHELVESLKLQHQITVKRSLGMGNVAAVLTLTEAGRNRGREYLEGNQYAGPAPVSLEQYVERVRRQKHRDGWLTKESLAQALRGMVVTERLMAQVGPAVSSAKSLLIYGQPGDGKSFLVESLSNLESTPIYLPYAIESQGNIIQVFDPIYHSHSRQKNRNSRCSRWLWLPATTGAGSDASARSSSAAANFRWTCWTCGSTRRLGFMKRRSS